MGSGNSTPTNGQVLGPGDPGEGNALAALTVVRALAHEKTANKFRVNITLSMPFFAAF